MFKKIISFFHNLFFYRRTKINPKDLRKLVETTLFQESLSRSDILYLDYLSRYFNGK